MKSDYTTNSCYITHTIAFWKVGRIHFLSSGVKGLSSHLQAIQITVQQYDIVLLYVCVCPILSRLSFSLVYSGMVGEISCWYILWFIPLFFFRSLLMLGLVQVNTAHGFSFTVYLPHQCKYSLSLNPNWLEGCLSHRHPISSRYPLILCCTSRSKESLCNWSKLHGCPC